MSINPLMVSSTVQEEQLRTSVVGSGVRIAFVTFSRQSDGELLALSTKTLKAHGLTNDEKRFPRIVVDEQASLVADPECDWHFTREFSRGSSLDGIECVTGMVQVYQEIAERYPDCDYLLKMDAEVAMLDTKFIKVLATRAFHHVGHGIHMRMQNREGKLIGELPYCQGAAYALSLATIRQLPRDVDSIHDSIRDANQLSNGLLAMPRERAFTYPEDETISQLVRLLYRDEKHLGWEYQDAPFGHLGTWDHARNEAKFNRAYFNRMGVFDFLDFGKTSVLTAEHYAEFAARRQVSLEVMQQCVEALLESSS